MPPDHLSRLLPPETGEPFYKSALRNLRELARPPAPPPPLELTSKPVPVKDIWGLYGRQKRSFAISTGLQLGLIALMFLALSSKTVQKRVAQVVPLMLPDDIRPPKPAIHEGGGGGGDRSPLPASKGRLPKIAPRQFVPPSAVINHPQPKLAMEASILAPPDWTLPDVSLPNYGDPLARLGAASNGIGSGGGIGSGKAGGVGAGSGGGAGPGDGGGIVYNPGHGGVTLPTVIHQEDPEFSDEARKAHYQGQVVVAIEVDPTGHVIHPRIVQGAGLGLDEKALEAAVKWVFRPGTLHGKPVTTRATISMVFRLL